MIVTELLDDNLVKTYSDQNMYIRGGFPEGLYTEAIDPVDLHREYVETDIPIPEPAPEPDPDIEPEHDPTDEEYSQVGKILIGIEE